MSQSFEGYENPNEYDISGDSNWVGDLTKEVGTLSGADRNGSNFAYFLLGTSLTQPASYPALGDQHASYTYGNMHNYFGSRNAGTPGWGDFDAQGNSYGSIAFNLDEVAVASPGLPVMTTETGYTNDLSVPNHATEAIAAVGSCWNSGMPA